jgi:hypothetical protein
VQLLRDHASLHARSRGTAVALATVIMTKTSFETITDLAHVTGGTQQMPAECKGMKKFYEYAVKHPDEHPSPAAFCRSARAQMNAPAPSTGMD